MALFSRKRFLYALLYLFYLHFTSSMYITLSLFFNTKISSNIFGTYSNIKISISSCRVYKENEMARSEKDADKGLDKIFTIFDRQAFLPCI